jgi:hypothetical protein
MPLVLTVIARGFEAIVDKIFPIMDARSAPLKLAHFYKYL